MRLARARLAVGEDAYVGAGEHLLQERRDELGVHLLLRRVAAKHVVEPEEALRSPRADGKKALATARVCHAGPAAVVELVRKQGPHPHSHSHVSRSGPRPASRPRGRVTTRDCHSCSLRVWGHKRVAAARRDGVLDPSPRSRP